MITLEKITILDDSMKECIALNVAPDQQGDVWSNAITLAVAHRRYKRFSAAMECRAIYAHGKMVGLISYNYYTEDADFKEVCYRIRPIMVDKDSLGKGYEKAALVKLLEEIKTMPVGDATAIFASYGTDAVAEATLYEEAGFTKTDMKWADPTDEDIIVRMGL